MDTGTPLPGGVPAAAEDVESGGAPAAPTLTKTHSAAWAALDEEPAWSPEQAQKSMADGASEGASDVLHMQLDLWISGAIKKRTKANQHILDVRFPPPALSHELPCPHSFNVAARGIRNCSTSGRACPTAALRGSRMSSRPKPCPSRT